MVVNKLSLRRNQLSPLHSHPDLNFPLNSMPLESGKDWISFYFRFQYTERTDLKFSILFSDERDLNPSADVFVDLCMVVGYYLQHLTSTWWWVVIWQHLTLARTLMGIDRGFACN